MNKIIIQNKHLIGLSEEERYVPDGKESLIEEKLIKQLENSGYILREDIKSASPLLSNLREKINALNINRSAGLNGKPFSDSEWTELLTKYLCNPTFSDIEKTYWIQKDSPLILTRDDGSKCNIILFDKESCSNNSFEIIHQFSAPTSEPGYDHREYDVTILINGLPLFHLELKRKLKSIQEAHNQIKNYKKYSFNEDTKLWEFVQIFGISNGIETKYYSKSKIEQFSFVTNWTDFENNEISNLFDFAKTFLNKETLHSIISKYCLLSVTNELFVLAPHQIAAAEAFYDVIKKYIDHFPINDRRQAGGYIYHGAGSGKTIAALKAVQLIIQNPKISKGLLIVDRCALDSQITKEFSAFGADVTTSYSTKKLLDQLIDPTVKIIVTTIQKLSRLIEKILTDPSYAKYSYLFSLNLAMIFDECHRSQSGNMHWEILNNFKKAFVFGMTGTPIYGPTGQIELTAGLQKHNFLKYAKTSISPSGDLKSTSQIFGKELHRYSSYYTIKDKRTLPFDVLEYNVMSKKDFNDFEAQEINKNKILLKDERINQNIDFIKKNFDSFTLKSPLNSKRMFNGMLSTQNIEMNKKYYQVITKKCPELRVATLFCPEEDFEKISETSDRVFYSQAKIDFYKNIKGIDKSNFKIDDTTYQNDVTEAVRNKEIDLLIVVNMCLEGFDSKWLNTHFIDKSLEDHNLIQAVSRTNRICNDLKTAGKIIFFYPKAKEKWDHAVKLYLTDYDHQKAQPTAANVKFQTLFDQYISYKNELITMFPDPEVELVDPTKIKNFIDKVITIRKHTITLCGFVEFNKPEVQNKLLKNLNNYIAYAQKYLFQLRSQKSQEDVSFLVKYDNDISEDWFHVDKAALIKISNELKQKKLTPSEFKKQLEPYAIQYCEKKSVAKQLVEFVGSAKTTSEGIANFKNNQLNNFSVDFFNLVSDLKIKNVEKFKIYIDKCLLNGEVMILGDDLVPLLPSVSRRQQSLYKQIKMNAINKIKSFIESYSKLDFLTKDLKQ